MLVVGVSWLPMTNPKLIFLGKDSYILKRDVIKAGSDKLDELTSNLDREKIIL